MPRPWYENYVECFTFFVSQKYRVGRYSFIHIFEENILTTGYEAVIFSKLFEKLLFPDRECHIETV